MTRFQRRKAARPGEITEAALDEFERHGYARSRVDRIAQRAGVSKGLVYLYFKTKEELFKAVVRSVVVPRVDALVHKLDARDADVIEFLRGPFVQFLQGLARSRARVVIRLLIAEGPRHPDLTAWYYDTVIGPALNTLKRHLQRGVASGQIRDTGLSSAPQLLMAPALMALMWKILFEEHQHLDTDAMLQTYVDHLTVALSPVATT